jgi:hypothetical protein
LFNFENQIQTPLAGFPFSVSLSILEWSPLIEVSSKMPREIHQLIKALPKMAKAARNPDLRNAFIEHLEHTKGHLDRLK